MRPICCFRAMLFNEYKYDRAIDDPVGDLLKQGESSQKTNRLTLPSETGAELSICPSTWASIREIDKAIA